MIEDFSQDGCRYLEIRTTPRATSSMSAEEYGNDMPIAADEAVTFVVLLQL